MLWHGDLATLQDYDFSLRSMLNPAYRSIDNEIEVYESLLLEKIWKAWHENLTIDNRGWILNSFVSLPALWMEKSSIDLEFK